MQYNDDVMSVLAQRRLSVSALIMITVATYANAFRGDFQFDDYPTILENTHYTDWSTYTAHVAHIIRPLSSLTFAIDRTLYGTSPAGYHLLNMLLHLGSGLLIYGIVRRAIPNEHSVVPLWSAILFLIHPVATETVTYISGRATGLMAFWYLAGLFLYINASEGARGMTPVPLRQIPALLCFALALASKETAATFPVVLLLWDGVVRRLDCAALRKAVLLVHGPYWLGLVIFLAWAWWHPRYSLLASFSLDIRPPWVNWLSEVHAAVYALIVFFIPTKQSFDHDLPEFHSLFQWPLPLDLLMLGGSAFAGFVLIRRVPLASFGIGWFFLQLLPTSLLPRNDLLSERNLYLASIGLCIAVVVLSARGWCRLTRTRRRPGLVRVAAGSATLAVVFGLAVMTVTRNDLYGDQVSLWSDTVRKSPNKPRPHNNLGHAYALRGDWDRAIDEFRTAAQLDPNYPLARQNLRDAYLRRVGRQ